jgi:hypothetical protein
VCLNTYVTARLERWAAWSWQRLDGQHFRLSQYRYSEKTDHGFTDGVVPIAAEALAAECAVSWLQLQRRRLGVAVIAVYRDFPGHSSTMVARSC